MPKNKVQEYNQRSLINLQEQSPFLITTNPNFFDPELMDRYGFQDFKVVQEEGKEFLYVDRYVLLGEKAVQLNTSVYAIDKNNVITHIVNNIKKKIRSIMRFRTKNVAK